MRMALRGLLRCGWALLALLILSTGAFGQAVVPREFVQGELVVSVRQGTPRAEVEALAASVNARIVSYLGVVDHERTMDAYHLRMTAPGTPDNVTRDAAAKLRLDRRVRFAGVNRLMKWLDITPNDPRYGEQWHLRLLRMPQAWEVEKGKDTVTVAVLDSGVDADHPDLASRLLPGRNTDLDNTDLTDNAPHGTHVIGIIAAATNNNLGVAGVTFEGVRVLPVKIGDAPSIVAAIKGLNFAEQQGAKVVNISFGGPDQDDNPNLDDPFNAAILRLARKGVVFSISAGNDGPGAPPTNPANMANAHPNIFCVAACGPDKEIAAYSSQRDYTTITAPGGNDLGGQTSRQILSTLPNDTYGFAQGTSMAAPAFAGVVAVLLSIPGVTPEELREAVISTADRSTAGAVPNRRFGWGIVDAYAAAQAVGISVTVVAPEGTGGKASAGGLPREPEPIETLRPLIQVRVRQVIVPDLTLKIDDQPVTITTDMITNITGYGTDPDGNTVPNRYDVVFFRDLSPGRHKITVTGRNPGPPERVVTDTRLFEIVPRLVAPGRSLISIPYFQDGVSPETYFGRDFRLARWVPQLERYAFYTPSGGDAGASFTPPGAEPHPIGGTPKPPLGLAFWADLDAGTPILTKGQPVSDQPFVIPLRGNSGTSDGRFITWHMIGNPFPFDVPFNTLLVDAPEGRISIRDAVDRGYLLPNLYVYDGAFGYTFKTLPDGVLKEWTGHWIGATTTADLDLIVPPVTATRAAALAPSRAPSAEGGWVLRLSASVRGLRDSFNFIGTASRAVDGYDLNDVPKPPVMSPFVSLGIHNESWGRRAGLYAQDLRAPGGQKAWSVLVNTDQPDSTVTVSWDSVRSLPRTVKLTLKDEATGQVIDMRARSSFTFNSGSTPGPRRLVVASSQASGNALRISNLTVQPSGGRASGATSIAFTLSADATYEVRVLSATGRHVGTVATRAAGAGDVRTVWNGKDAAGRSVPAGTYVVQVRAFGPDGESVRVIQPFAVLR